MSAFDDATRWLAKDNKRKNRERGRRGEGAQQQRRNPPAPQSRGGVANTVVGTVIGTTYGIAQATTCSALGDFLPGQGGTFDQNWAESTAVTERDRRSRQMDQETRARGGRHRWTSR